MVKLREDMFTKFDREQAFGLQADQLRSGRLFQNAGWFKDDGQFIGYGDLCIRDLVNIARDLDWGEKFYVLFESDWRWGQDYKNFDAAIVSGKCIARITRGQILLSGRSYEHNGKEEKSYPCISPQDITERYGDVEVVTEAS